jgi:hypothetical protein
VFEPNRVFPAQEGPSVVAVTPFLSFYLVKAQMSELHAELAKSALAGVFNDEFKAKLDACLQAKIKLKKALCVNGDKMTVLQAVVIGRVDKQMVDSVLKAKKWDKWQLSPALEALANELTEVREPSEQALKLDVMCMLIKYCQNRVTYVFPRKALKTKAARILQAFKQFQDDFNDSHAEGGVLQVLEGIDAVISYVVDSLFMANMWEMTLRLLEYCLTHATEKQRKVLQRVIAEIKDVPADIDKDALVHLPALIKHLKHDDNRLGSYLENLHGDDQSKFRKESQVQGHIVDYLNGTNLHGELKLDSSEFAIVAHAGKGRNNSVFDIIIGKLGLVIEVKYIRKDSKDKHQSSIQYATHCTDQLLEYIQKRGIRMVLLLVVIAADCRDVEVNGLPLSTVFKQKADIVNCYLTHEDMKTLYVGRTCDAHCIQLQQALCKPVIQSVPVVAVA